MIFGKDAERTCAMCEFGFINEDTGDIKCAKHKNKEFSPDHKCRKFVYDPLKKSPRTKPKMHEYSAEDFQL